MSMNERNVFNCGLVSALTLVGAISIAVSGCHSPQGCGTKTDAEGFTWYSDADIGRIGTQQDFLKTAAEQIMANKDKINISTLADI